MNNFTKTMLGVVAFLLAMAGVQHALQSYREHAAAGKAGESFEQLKEKAAQKRPDAPASEALAEEAIEQVNAKLSAETDAQKRRITAANTFMGFFLVNTRERPVFCREQGVDIQPFVTSFEQGHVNEAAMARRVRANQQITEDRLYEMLKTQFRQVIAQDMRDIASAQKASLKDACQLLVTHSTEIVREMHISKVQPAVHQALMAPGP